MAPSSSFGTRMLAQLRILAAGMLLISSVTPTAVFAQETQSTGVMTDSAPFGERDLENPDLDNTYQPTPIYVMEAGIAEQTSTAVRGFASIKNASMHMVGDVTLRTEIWGTNEAGELLPLLFDYNNTETVLTLSPEEETQVEFSHTLPALPAGNYVLRVQTMNTGGQEYGWNDLSFTVENSAYAFVYAYPGMMSIPEYVDTEFSPLSGPNLTAGSSFTVRGSYENKSTTSQSVYPVVRIYPFDTVNGQIDEQRMDLQTVTAGETAAFSYELIAPQDSGVYVAQLSLETSAGEKISSIAQYRIVVRGADARILSTRIANAPMLKDDVLYAYIDLAGAPDAETVAEYEMTVTLRDANGLVGLTTLPAMTLSDTITEGAARVTLERDIIGSPVVEVTLSHNGELVHTHATTFKADADVAGSTLSSSWNEWMKWHGVARLALYLLAALTALSALWQLGSLFGRSKTFRAHTLTSISLVAVLMSTVSPAFAAGSNVGGVEVFEPKDLIQYSNDWKPIGSHPTVALFINEPRGNQPAGTYDLENVPLSYRVEYGVCKNETPATRVIGRFDRSGGSCINTLEGSSSTRWVEVHDETYNDTNCSGYYCIASPTFSGTVDLSSLDDSASKTTFQLAAKWTYDRAKFGTPSDDIDLDDRHFQGQTAHAVNFCINTEPAEEKKPDLTLEKSVYNAGSNLQKGGHVMFLLTARNEGEAIAEDVVIRDEIPNGLEFDPVSSENNPCQVEGGDVVCRKGRNSNDTSEDLEPGRHWGVYVRFAVPDHYKPGYCPAPIHNSAWVETSSDEESTSNNDADAEAEVACNDNHSSSSSSSVRSSSSRSSVSSSSSNGGNNRNPDLRMEKSVYAPGGNMQKGGHIMYLLRMYNDGNIHADNVVIRDSIPTGLIFDPIHTTDNVCNQEGNEVVCRKDVGLNNGLEAGNYWGVYVRFRIPATYGGNSCPARIENTARAETSSYEPNTSNNTDSETAYARCDGSHSSISSHSSSRSSLSSSRSSTGNNNEPDLMLEKTVYAQGSDLQKGGYIMFLVNAKNIGQSLAENIVIRDEIPTGLIYAPFTTIDNPCTQEGNQVVCRKSIGDANGLYPWQTWGVYVRFKIPSNYAGNSCPATIQNTAWVESSTYESATSNNQAQASATVDCRSTSSSSTSSHTSSSSVSSSSSSQTAVRKPDLTLEKSVYAPGGNRIKGGHVMFLLTARNVGNAQADNVVIRDSIPAGLTFDPVDSNDNVCTKQGNEVVCVKGLHTSDTSANLEAGRFWGVYVRFKIDAQLNGSQCPTTVDNTARVATTTVESSTANNSASATATITCETVQDNKPNLTLEKSVYAPGGDRTKGGYVMFLLTARNVGTIQADNVVIRDTIPAGLEFAPFENAGNPCHREGNEVVCVKGTASNDTSTDLEAGRFWGVYVRFKIPENYQPGICPAQIHNTARVHTTSTETTLADNTAEADTVASCSPSRAPNLTLEKTVYQAGSSLKKGGHIMYLLTARNVGTIAAENVVIRDSIPAGLTYAPLNTAENPCRLEGNDVVCVKGRNSSDTSTDLAANHYWGVYVRFDIPQNYGGNSCPASITNTAHVTSSSQESSTADNTATVTSSVVCDGSSSSSSTSSSSSSSAGTPNLILEKSVYSPASDLRKGRYVMYLLTARNIGTATAHNVVIRDTIPAGLTYAPLDNPENPCTQEGNEVVCVKGRNSNGTGPDLIGAHYWGVYVRFSIANTFGGDQCPAPLTNVARVVTSDTETSTADNTATVTSSVSCNTTGTPNLTLEKSVYSAGSDLRKGGHVMYLLTARNTGTFTAENVVIRDTIPAGLTYAPLSNVENPCRQEGNEVVCVKGRNAADTGPHLAAGHYWGVYVRFTIPTSFGGTQCPAPLTNVARVATSTAETTTADNSAIVTSNVQCDAVLNGCIEIQKIAIDTNDQAMNSVPSFTFTLDSSRSVQSNANGYARFDNVTAGTHTVVETVPSNWVLESVSPAGGTVQVASGNSCAQLTFRNRQIEGGRNFSITKTDGESEVEPEDELTYTIRVRNNSSVTVRNVTVTDTLPDEVHFRDCSDDCDRSGRFITWDNQDFAPFEEKRYEVEVEVDEDADGTIVNYAYVFDEVARDETDIDDDKVKHRGDGEIELTKDSNTAEVFPGGIIEYTVRIENTGDVDLEDLLVVDDLPSGVTIIDDGDADEKSSSRLEWEIDELEEGDDWEVTYRVAVDTAAYPGTLLRNDVCVEEDDEDIDECESRSVIVIGNLPQTGFSGSYGANLISVEPIQTGSSSSLPFAAWFSLFGLMSGAGLGFGRRMLIGF